MKQILVPVDLEPQSLIALEQSYNLARLLPAGTGIEVTFILETGRV